MFKQKGIMHRTRVSRFDRNGLKLIINEPYFDKSLINNPARLMLNNGCRLVGNSKLARSKSNVAKSLLLSFT